jgi:hypothetical protein
MRAALIMATAALAAPVAAQADPGFKPIVDARLRYEAVDQAGIARDADALTVRMRAGFELSRGDFVFLAESEATLAIVGDYNSGTNRRTGFPIVPDPANIELNRLQLQYRGLPGTVVTIGRQRINLDDQRFVGSVGWRQNEQTFNAARIETAVLGPVTIDLAYAWSDRTTFGIDSPIQAISGDNVFAGAGMKLGPVAVKGFAYLLDQDEPGRRQFSSQTYGARATTALPLGPGKLSLVASYARQSDWRGNPNDYAADYWLAEAGLGWKSLTVTAGYEVLGASSGAAYTSFQTPLATLHKFQGWADKFLVTPANGVRDAYGSIAWAMPQTPLGPVSLLVVYHRFDSDRLGLDYGSEWDAQIGVKPAKRIGLLVKYADYDADSFATDTRKLWFQIDYNL